MLSTEEKLKRFSDFVLKDARNQSVAMVQEAEKKAKKENDVFETACLETAYKTIQKQMAQIVRTEHEKTSKAGLGAKSALLKKREEMLGQIFDAATEKLLAYRKTDDYQQDMLALIEAAKKEDKGEGITVSIVASDAPLKEKLVRAGVTVHVLENDASLGGMYVFVNGTNCVLDFSYARKLKEAQEAFIDSGALALS